MHVAALVSCRCVCARGGVWVRECARTGMFSKHSHTFLIPCAYTHTYACTHRACMYSAYVCMHTWCVYVCTRGQAKVCATHTIALHTQPSAHFVSRLHPRTHPQASRRWRSRRKLHPGHVETLAFVPPVHAVLCAYVCMVIGVRACAPSKKYGQRQ